MNDVTTETKTIIKQNGIKRPETGSVTGKLWDIADRLSESKGAPATRKEVVDAYLAEVPNANQATGNTQYARWVSFHGIAKILADARKAETEQRKADKSKESDAEKQAKIQKKLDAEAEKARKKQEREDAAKAKAEDAARKKQEKADAKAKAEAEKAAAKANPSS